MKICHFAATPGIGRGEAFVEIANAMSTHSETHLLVPSNSLFKNNISSDVHPFFYKRLGSRRNVFLFFELYFYFKKNKFDLVHTHFAKATSIFLNINRLLKIPHLATKHNPRKSKIFDRVKHVTVVSKAALESVNSNFSPAIVIKNGIVSSKKMVHTKESPGHPFKILAIGRLDKIKGFDFLINQVSKLNFDCKLLIAGSGPEESRLKKLAEENLSPEKCEFLGFRYDIENLMNQCDLVVSSSHSEGCPMVLIESLFYAKLFISTPVGEAVELLDPDFICNITELGKKISEAYFSYSSMSSRFRSFAEMAKHRYCSTHMVEQYFDSYKFVLRGEGFPSS